MVEGAALEMLFGGNFNEGSNPSLSVPKTKLVPMGQYDRLILLAEDQLTEYSTDALKIEKLRRKIGISVPLAEQRQIKATLLEEMPKDWFNKTLETQRQTLALPFWGIAGLGLLFGISASQPLDFIATIVGGAIAIKLQKQGWKLQAKRLVLQTLEDIEQRMNPTPAVSEPKPNQES